MDCVKIQATQQSLDVVALKKKVITEFDQLLRRIKKGYKPDYEFILQEISLIQLLETLDNVDFFKQFYLNNAWQTQF